MRKNWKFAAMTLVAGMALFTTACSSDDDPAANTGNGNGTEESYVLDKDITENVTLETGKNYTLNSCKGRSYAYHPAGGDHYCQA